MKPHTPIYSENPSRDCGTGWKGAQLASDSIGNAACAPLHFASCINAPNAPLIAFLFDTNEAPPKKLTCSKQSRNHFLFNTFARFFLRPPFAANAARRYPACPEILGEGNPRSGTGEACPPRRACLLQQGSLFVFLQPSLESATIAPLAAIFTRPTNSTRTLRMLLINDAPIRIARNSLNTNNGDQF
jgi:hypothetical protein